MNPYKKWGITYVNSFLRHMSATMALWGTYEIKYKEFNWKDMLLAIFVGAVVPTLKEFFSAGIPIFTETTTEVVTETKTTNEKTIPIGPTPGS